MKGKPCKYESKKCESCKETKVIHSFARVCKECKRLKRVRKHYKEDVNPIHREPVVCVKPNNEILAESCNMRTLIKVLNSELRLPIRAKGLYNDSKKLFKDVSYWYYKGLFFMYKKDYTPEKLDEIYFNRISKDYTRKEGYKINYSEHERQTVSQILTLRNHHKMKTQDIADKVGWSKSRVSHVLTGWSYSKLTGIVYKRAHNVYGEDGDVIIEKERTANKFSYK